MAIPNDNIIVNKKSKYFIPHTKKGEKQLDLDQKKMPKFVLLIHGGVGTILRENMTADQEKAFKAVLSESIFEGEKILKNKGSALHAVEAAVKVMEDSPLFNAGKGAVFTHEGKNEMDASIMDGQTLKAGAVAGVSFVKNPIIAARKVMDNTGHVMLIADGAEKFAKEQGCEMEDASYFQTEHRLEQLEYAKKHDEISLDHTGENKIRSKSNPNLGTVGAVALDLKGNLAAATSTGGMTNKKYGRVGDSSIIGAGTYANNDSCAVSCTGHGEYFIRNVVAYDVAALVDYKKLSLKEATEFVILQKLGNNDIEGGLIAIDKDGNFEMTFNTSGMYRASVTSDTPKEILIFK